MAVPYDVSLIGNVTSIYDLVLGLNKMSNGLLGLGLWVAPFLIYLVIGIGTPDFKSRIMATGYFNLISAVLLFGLELLTKRSLGISVALFFATLAYHRFSASR